MRLGGIEEAPVAPRQVWQRREEQGGVGGGGGDGGEEPARE